MRYLQILLLCILLVIAGYAQKPKNIILFIGDGMGVSQITAGKITLGDMHMDRFKVLGLLTTFAADKLVTDSAASGTAMATGKKTNNKYISISPEGDTLKTSLEYAADAGKATGLVSTSIITHATPASFGSHVDSRYEYNEIAKQLTENNIDVIIGGGWQNFIPESVDSSKREDELDLLEKLSKTHMVARSFDELVNSGSAEKLVGLLEQGHLPKANDRSYTLAQLTQKAIDALSKDSDGFFLMVEGSQIDWGGHDNESDYIVGEVKDFDGAIGKALDFAEQDGNTLVVVTADHETGGYAILDGSVDEKTITKTGFSTTGHSASMVAVFAFGPGAQAFAGIQDNTVIGQKMIEYLVVE